ncbi:MAG: filamentous hemagglutinin family protein, partial [Gammaproteobacteria bacterium]
MEASMLAGPKAVRLNRLSAAVLFGIASMPAHANPTGPTVLHGNVGISRPSAGVMNIANSPNAIINWNGFSIARGEVTRFLQQNANSAVLNRVLGQNPSAILGQLLSNGRVFVINPNGIVFGPNAIVNTQGLIASTLDISNENFLAGKYQFEAGATAGSINNQGFIRSGPGGEVILIAPSIENSGIIQADDGSLVLAAGRKVTFTSLDAGGVQFEAQAPEDAVVNLGQLIADRGTVGAFAGTLTNTGRIQARGITTDADGNIVLTAQGDITLTEGGSLDAGGDQDGGAVTVVSDSGTVWAGGEISARGGSGVGGDIAISGDRVAVSANVDVSGASGGGEVLVGGDEGGSGELPIARQVAITADAQLRADAIDSGDGGKVVVFAQDSANVVGGISARGGAQGGDGGFVETSGLRAFSISSTPDVSAPSGRGGTWLIDPHDIEIVAGSGNLGINAASPFLSAADSATLGVNLVTAALTGGATVMVTTGAGGAIEDGDITLSAALDFNGTGSNTLILTAHDDIFINASVTDGTAGGDSLNLVLTADSDISSAGYVFIDADVELGAGGALTTNGQGASVGAGATVTLDAGVWEHSTQTLIIGDGSAGTVNLQNGASLVDVGQPFTVIVGSGVGGDGTLNVLSGSTVDIGDDFGNSGHLFIAMNDASALGSVTLDNATLATLGDSNSIVVGYDGLTSSGGGGSMIVSGGAFVDTLELSVGEFGSGDLLVTGAGTELTVSPDHGLKTGIYATEGGFVGVGIESGSDGLITVSDGAVLEIRDEDDGVVGSDLGTTGASLMIAEYKGSIGDVIVEGSGSTLDILQLNPQGTTNDVLPGPGLTLERGLASLTVRNGGLVSLDGPGAMVAVSVGRQGDDPTAGAPDGTATITINDEMSGGGASGLAGLMAISGDEASVRIGGFGSLGSEQDNDQGDGRIQLVGAGTRLDITGNGDGSNGLQATLEVGASGFGMLEVDDGALLQLLGANDQIVVGRRSGASGIVDISNGGGIDNPGTVTGDNGAALTIAPVLASSGLVNVEGAGSFFNTGRWLRVGLSELTGYGQSSGTAGGSATVDILAGATMRTSTALIGNGTVTVSGDDGFATPSLLQIVETNSDPDTRDRITIGHVSGSVAQLNVLAGARVDAGPQVEVARWVGSFGNVTIDNATFDILGVDTDNDDRAPNLAVGRGGTGTLTVSNNGIVTLVPDGATPGVVEFGGMKVGGSSNENDDVGQGTVTVTGSGSRIDIVGARTLLRLGREAGTSGTVNILDGGVIGFDNSAADVFGLMAHLGGTATLTINQGQLDLEGLSPGTSTLYVGQTTSLVPGGFATVTLVDSVDGATTPELLVNVMNLAGELTGEGDITGTVATQGGEIAPGFSVGVLRVGGLILDANSLVDIEIAGTPGSGLFDQIVVTGGSLAQIDGTLIVTELDPHENVQFDAYSMITTTAGIDAGANTFATIIESFGDNLSQAVNGNDLEITVDVVDDFFVFTGATSNTWSVLGNWEKGGVAALVLPSSADDVLIPDLGAVGIDTTVIIDAGAGPTLGAAQLQVEENLLMSAAGATFTVTAGFNIDNAFVDGLLTIDDGDFVIGSAGELFTSGVQIGTQVGQTGTLTVQGDLENIGVFDVGGAGNGSFTVVPGGFAFTTGATLNVATVAGGSGTITTQSGGVMQNTDGVIVGAGGIGVLTVNALSGFLTSSYIVGNSATGSGSFFLAASGESDGITPLTVGSVAGSTGSVVVDGAVITNIGDVTVGVLGTGTVTVQSGAELSGSGGVMLGSAAGSVGTMIVDASSIFMRDLIVGNSGTGVMNVINGSTIDLDSFTGFVEIGSLSGGTGTMVISGTDTQLTTRGTSNSVKVGEFGDGTLTLSDGAELHTRAFEVGHGAGSTGVAVIRGSGTRLFATDENGLSSDLSGPRVRSGREGSADITIDQGATVDIVTNDAVSTVLFGGYVSARIGGSVGNTVIDGAGTSVNISGSSSVFSAGRSGDGHLIVRNGAVVNMTGDDSRVRIGRSALSGGSTGSQLEILSGAKVNVNGFGASIRVGRDVDSVGDLVISGAGSELNLFGEDSSTYIGQSGTGTATVTFGGLLSAGANLNLGNEFGSDGELTIDGAGSIARVTEARNTTGIQVGAAVNIGRRGTGNTTSSNDGLAGNLTVINGGELQLDGGDRAFLQIDIGGSGTGTPGVGVLNVGTTGIGDDAGGGTISFMNTNTGSVDVGREGIGTLNMRAGATITGANIVSIAKDDGGLPGTSTVNLHGDDGGGNATSITLTKRLGTLEFIACETLGVCVVELLEPAQLKVGGYGAGALTLTGGATIVIDPDSVGLTPIANSIVSAGSINGIGTINAASVDSSAGIILPGIRESTIQQITGDLATNEADQIGTLTINGNLLLGASTEFEMQVGGGSLADRLVVNGDV